MSLLAGLSNWFTSKQQEKAADKQAQAILEAMKIDQTSANAAIRNALNIINPALSNTYEASQSVIDLFNEGRASSGDIITQQTGNAINALNQGGQASLNALLGVPSTPQEIQQSQAQTAIQQAAPQVAPQTQTNVIDTAQGPQQVTMPTGGFNEFVRPTDIDYGTPLATNAPRPSALPTEFGGRQLATNAPRQLGSTIDAVSGQVVDAAPQQNIGPVNPNTGLSYLNPETQPEGSILVGQDAIAQPQQLDAGFGSRTLDVPQFQAPTVSPQANIGLSGLESALGQARDQARFDLGFGATSGLDAQARRFGQAAQNLTQGRDFALNRINQAIQQSGQGYRDAASTIQQGAAQGASQALAGASQGAALLNPFISAGSEALNPYLSLSGARGQEAFDQALIDDPVYRYEQEQAQRALERSAGVTGNIGSGNVAAEIQRQRQGLAQANIDRQLGRYLPIIEGGRSAAGTAGGFLTQGGISAGNITAGGAQAAGGLLARGVGERTGLNTAAAQIGLGTGQDLSRLSSQLGLSEQQVLNQLGQNLGQAELNVGGAIGSARQGAGQGAANLINQLSQQQAGLQTGLGTNLSNLDQQTLANIANTISQQSGTDLSTRLGLAQLLSNINLGQGTSQAQYAQNLGTAQAAGVTNPVGNTLGNILGLLSNFAGQG